MEGDCRFSFRIGLFGGSGAGSSEIVEFALIHGCSFDTAQFMCSEGRDHEDIVGHVPLASDAVSAGGCETKAGVILRVTQDDYERTASSL